MKNDYKNAFDRHLADAKLLLKNQRLANADHHYGVAAECALKALLITQGIPSQDGEICKHYKAHINALWRKYYAFMQTKNTYPLPLANPFDDWNIDQRYSNENNITLTATENHRKAVEQTINNIVKKAKLDGVW